VIFGLVAALGWGLADFFGALASRRIGSLPAVVVGQILSAFAITAILLGSGSGLTSLAGLAGLIIVNGIVAMLAYASHYYALELGPVSVVSPVGAAYAVVGVLLAIIVLGERPSSLALAGMVCTIAGTVLVSTDLKALMAGLHERPEGLWWAVGSAVGFGVAGFTLGAVAKDSGVWQAAMFASRWAMIIAFVPLAIARRSEFSRLRAGATVGIWFALAAGAADILGVASYSAGATGGYLSIVLAASAVFPLVAVALSHYVLGERLVLNQYIGVGAVVGGLLLLGAGV
jgi:drug/metabolite transporter (DMT)-like permease